MPGFLNRVRELQRLRRAFERGARLVVVYGRRRLGKTRLLIEASAGAKSVVFAADLRDSALQREAMARELAAVVPGFAEPTYPDWDALLGQLRGFPDLDLRARLRAWRELCQRRPWLEGGDDFRLWASVRQAFIVRPTSHRAAARPEVASRP